MNTSTRQNLDHLFLRGKSYYSPYFKAKFLAADSNFFSVIVTKKQLPHAVDRNRAKRRVVNILRTTNLPAFSFALLVNKQVLDLDHSTLKSELKKFINLLKAQ